MSENGNGTSRDIGDNQDWRMGFITLAVLVVLAGAIGAEGQRFQVREIIGAYACVADTSGCLGFGQTFGADMKQWLMQLNPFYRPAQTGKYEQAMALADDIEKKMEQNAASKDPFRAVMADIWFQHHDKDHDPTLMADAYSMAQESRIFKGPE